MAAERVADAAEEIADDGRTTFAVAYLWQVTMGEQRSIFVSQSVCHVRHGPSASARDWGFDENAFVSVSLSVTSGSKVVDLSAAAAGCIHTFVFCR